MYKNRAKQLRFPSPKFPLGNQKKTTKPPILVYPCPEKLYLLCRTSKSRVSNPIKTKSDPGFEKLRFGSWFHIKTLAIKLISRFIEKEKVSFRSDTDSVFLVRTLLLWYNLCTRKNKLLIQNVHNAHLSNPFPVISANTIYKDLDKIIFY